MYKIIATQRRRTMTTIPISSAQIFRPTQQIRALANSPLTTRGPTKNSNTEQTRQEEPAQKYGCS